MRPRKDFSLAVAQYTAGASIEQVADAFGVTRQSMWAVLRLRGVTMCSQRRSGAANTFFRHGNGYAKEKRCALNRVTKAIRAGKLVPGACELCGFSGTRKNGSRAVHAHHDDYSKPLTVRWLCRPCHFILHQNDCVE